MTLPKTCGECELCKRGDSAFDYCDLLSEKDEHGFIHRYETTGPMAMLADCPLRKDLEVGCPDCLNSDNPSGMCDACAEKRNERVAQKYKSDLPTGVIDGDVDDLIRAESTHDLLEDRKKQYGEYRKVAKCAQQLKRVLRKFIDFELLNSTQAESLDMICNKLARLQGDADLVDTWRDIAGYAQLVVNELEGE